MAALQADPELGGVAEVAAQAQGGVRGDAALAPDKIVYARCGDMKILGEAVGGQAEGLHEFGMEDLPGMDGKCKRDFIHVFLLVIVHDLNIEGIGFSPNKAQAVLVIDANAVLPLAISRQRLKTISARYGQVRNTRCPVQCGELSQRHAPQVGWDASTLPRLPKQLSIGVFEALDHWKS